MLKEANEEQARLVPTELSSTRMERGRARLRTPVRVETLSLRVRGGEEAILGTKALLEPSCIGNSLVAGTKLYGLNLHLPRRCPGDP